MQYFTLEKKMTYAWIPNKHKDQSCYDSLNLELLWIVIQQLSSNTDSSSFLIFFVLHFSVLFYHQIFKWFVFRTNTYRRMSSSSHTHHPNGTIQGQSRSLNVVSDVAEGPEDSSHVSIHLCICVFMQGCGSCPNVDKQRTATVDPRDSRMVTWTAGGPSHC